jgi:hypothetical protein
MNITYYHINEDTARRAKEMRSFDDYVSGTATSIYKSEVDKAAARVEAAKARVEPQYHDKMDAMFDKFCRRLAEYYNKDNEISTRCPSVMIAGAANFPVRQKERQIAAWNSNMKNYQNIMEYLNKICSVGRGGISSDDPNAVDKLQKKLENLEHMQELMKGVNAYYRKHKGLDGCTLLTPEEVEKLKADMQKQWHYEDKPYMSYELTNNNANIRRVKQRIKELEQAAETTYEGWSFDGGRVVMNKETNRIQIIYDDKPDSDVRSNLKSYGFRWAPSVGVWQRQLNRNGIYAAKKVTGQVV